ncbi:MAG: WecB/TagA/CpsF family glycosyltransferase [Vagococcus fluvialis]
MRNYEVEKILDVPVDILTMSDIINDVEECFKENTKLTIASVNPQIILMSEQNKAVKDFIDQSTHRIADGIGIIKVSRWTKGKVTERVAGFDTMEELLRFCNTHKKRIFLYGARPEVVKLAGENIATTYPNLKLAGMIDGYTKLSDDKIVEQINEAQADMVFVALGSPKQEEWLKKNINLLSANVFQTIGGSLDVLSGTAKRAPKIYITLNLEWLYRSISNPKRLYRIFQLPVFVLKSINWHRKQGKH